MVTEWVVTHRRIAEWMVTEWMVTERGVTERVMGRWVLAGVRSARMVKIGAMSDRSVTRRIDRGRGRP